MINGYNSFNSIEQLDLIRLSNFMIEIGGKYGRVDAYEFWYGRNSIIEELSNQYTELITKISSKIKFADKFNSVCISSDIWSDKYTQSSFIGITIKIIDEDYSRKTFLLAFKVNSN